ncbi:MAG: response regulator transcription factor [Stomatobaculum sp.]|jgi:DNA-binding LytR/AlgR family response regulator|nr:response regulator transcription factor [Stomatobaculum sp.]
MVVHVAIVEDEEIHQKTLKEYLERYAKENGTAFHIDVFPNPILLLENYKPVYDLIFMDIQMPDINGMETARRLRAVDQNVLLIFVTSLAQYAIEGYEVAAMDYILKPVQYFSFAMKLTKVIWRINADAGNAVKIANNSGSSRLRLLDILYIEISGHTITYHTLDGGSVSGTGTLSEVEERLQGKQFARCNSCYLVNLQYVGNVKGYRLLLKDGTELQISQPRKKGFMQAVQEYHELEGKAD